MKTQKSPVVPGLIRNTSNAPIINKPKHSSKQDRMLRLFVSGARLHRFQAELYGDHSLHSTISSLQQRHHIYFDRVFIEVPTRFGTNAHVKEYCLAGENLAKARTYTEAIGRA